MKIMFWITPRAALVVILSTNLFIPTVNAENFETRIERKSEISNIHHSVLKLLEDGGLEKEAAFEKVSSLFLSNHAEVDRQFDNLSRHPELGIDDESLLRVLSKRALYGRNVDFRDYHSLTGLVHDIKKCALSNSERKAIHEVSALNQTV
ncbi:hypothetical protein Sulku_1188 [Sulfuricurvum kujiense DSM 16994]|uniref:Uncharacterized protein n=1 Tax=Sulfuricurvum kujiense (strain ATCC BAA-921 / DSM 16994 / JCM 11577 / YK-1) TaxID=709032 RepID=E4TX10_SULKY|nr:hypothetical protein [Sulfuricurvum kujiense]ADR33851.1 hypothetical protein Sulku_1188 [Sulfuricurvum kujiense DSM 16994]